MLLFTFDIKKVIKLYNLDIINYIIFIEAKLQIFNYLRYLTIVYFTLKKEKKVNIIYKNIK